MKKQLFIAAIALLANAAPAQANTRYCEMNIIKPGFKNYVAKIKYSDKPTYVFVKDNAGNKVKFPSEMDALNYLFAQGWQLVACYRSQDETHFFLKK